MVGVSVAGYVLGFLELETAAPAAYFSGMTLGLHWLLNKDPA
jgi:hypothetical protein